MSDTDMQVGDSVARGGIAEDPGDATGRPAANPLHAILAVAVAQAAEAVMVTAPDGTIIYVNPAFERLTG